MGHTEAKMSSKGQITVPAAVRRALNLKEGDTVDFLWNETTREVTLRARNLDVEALFGIAGVASLPLDAVDATILDAATEDDRRAMASKPRRGTGRSDASE